MIAFKVQTQILIGLKELNLILLRLPGNQWRQNVLHNIS